MGNTHSHNHEPREKFRTRHCNKRDSRTDSEHSNNTTSTSSSSMPRLQSTRAPSSPRYLLGRRSYSLKNSHKLRNSVIQEPEIKPPIRIGYPYYEEVTLLAEKGEKKYKRHSLRRSMNLWFKIQWGPQLEYMHGIDQSSRWWWNEDDGKWKRGGLWGCGVTEKTTDAVMKGPLSWDVENWNSNETDRRRSWNAWYIRYPTHFAFIGVHYNITVIYLYHQVEQWCTLLLCFPSELPEQPVLVSECTLYESC